MFRLIKEIKSKTGEIHFRRYLLFSTPWFHCYLHRIYKADQDLHLHNHPWNFWGMVLWGGYLEKTSEGIKTRGFLSCGGGNRKYFHKIEEMITSPTTTLFFVGKKTYPWGYKTSEGIIEQSVYRERKNQGSLPLG